MMQAAVGCSFKSKSKIFRTQSYTYTYKLLKTYIFQPLVLTKPLSLSPPRPSRLSLPSPPPSSLTKDKCAGNNLKLDPSKQLN